MNHFNVTKIIKKYFYTQFQEKKKFSSAMYLKPTSFPLVYQAAVLLEQERQQEMAKMGGPRAMAPISALRGMMVVS